MCSIGVTNHSGLKDSNNFSQKRGPDNTNIKGYFQSYKYF